MAYTPQKTDEEEGDRDPAIRLCAGTDVAALRHRKTLRR
jgi:hypothetical protein